MADNLSPRMDWSDTVDQAGSFSLFKQKCELYFSVKSIPKEKQVDHILLFAGEEGLKKYNSWDLSNEEENDPDEIWKKFKTQVEPKSSFRIARFYLQKYRQTEGETIDDFVSGCKL